MTELIQDMFKNVGRNDDCPCGSGKKFKKCHEQTLKLQKEAEKKTRRVEQLIGPKTIPWHVYKLMGQAHSDNLPNLLWEMGHELGPFREKYKTMESYLLATTRGDDRMPASPAFELRWIRVDGPDVFLLLNRGLKDPKTSNVVYEIVHLRPNEFGTDRTLRTVTYNGFRIWDIRRSEVSKAESENHDLRLSDLGYEWAPEWHSPDSPFKPMPMATV